MDQQQGEFRGTKAPESSPLPPRPDPKLQAMGKALGRISQQQVLPPRLSKLFVAKVDSVVSSKITWTEQCLVNGPYVDYGGGRQCNNATDPSAATALDPSMPMPKAGDFVLLIEDRDPAATGGPCHRYRFVTAGSSSSKAMMTMTPEDPQPSGMGGGIYVGYLVTGDIPSTFDATVDEAMPEGMTVTTTLCYFVNTDEDYYSGTHCLATDRHFHGWLRGFTSGGIPIIVGESVNEDVTNTVAISSTSSSVYSGDTDTWVRDTVTSGTNYGGTAFTVTLPARLAIYHASDGGGSAPAAGTINLNEFTRTITVGACGRFYRVDAESMSLLLALPDFDVSSSPSDGDVFQYVASTGKWTKMTPVALNNVVTDLVIDDTNHQITWNTQNVTVLTKSTATAQTYTGTTCGG